MLRIPIPVVFVVVLSQIVNIEGDDGIVLYLFIHSWISFVNVFISCVLMAVGEGKFLDKNAGNYIHCDYDAADSHSTQYFRGILKREEEYLQSAFSCQPSVRDDLFLPTPIEREKQCGRNFRISGE